MVRWLVLVLLGALSGGLPSGGMGAVTPCLDKDELGDVDAVVMALVDVHGGPNCDQVKLKSLQKIAAAQHAANMQNVNAPIKIGVHVMDTCSNKKKALRLAFKSLVYTDPSICSRPPLLLGFIGPDDAEILDAVQQVTKVYKHVHVNSVALVNSPNPFHMIKIEQAQKVKAIRSVLRQLNWSTFSLLHSADAEAAQLSAALASSGGVCVPLLRQVARETDPTSDVKTRGVLVVGSAATLTEVVRSNAALDSPHALLLVSLETGVMPPLALLDTLTENALLLQHAAARPIPNLDQQLKKSYLWDEYLHQQRCNFSTCSVEDSEVAELAAAVQDVATAGVSQAMAAFAKALKSVHRAKCGGRDGRCPALDATQPEEWRKKIGAETAFQGPVQPHFEVFLKQAYTQGLLKLSNFSQLDFPESRGEEDCIHQVQTTALPTKRPLGVTRRPTTTTTTPVPRLPPVNFEDDDYHVEESHEEEDSDYSDSTEHKTVKDISDEEDDDSDSVEEKVQTDFKSRTIWEEIHQLSALEFGIFIFGFTCCVGFVLGILIYCIYCTFHIAGPNDRNKNRGHGSPMSARSRPSIRGSIQSN